MIREQIEKITKDYLNYYNEENDTRIKIDDLDMYEITEEILNLIHNKIEQVDW